MVDIRIDAAPTAPHGLDSELTPFLLEDLVGGTFNGKPVYNQTQVIGQLDWGSEISGKTITYSFLDTPVTIGLYNNPTYSDIFSEPGGYSPFSEDQREAARMAMEFWDDLIPQDIVEKNGLGADIIFANTTTGPAQAHAYLPGKGPKVLSDVWTATPEVNFTNAWLGFNGYGLTTLVHEAGHALGLTHPGDYDFGEDEDGDGEPDPITYADDAEYLQDSLQYTIMSYFSPQETFARPVNVELRLLGQPQTPLLHDILAIQAKYGADPTTRAGDTVYGFNSTAGHPVYDFSVNRSPNLSIYDAGGIDTLDLSGAGAGVFLDLRPGAFSSAATLPTLEQANAAVAEFNTITDEDFGDLAAWTPATWNSWLASDMAFNASRIALFTGVTGVNALSFSNISIAYNTVIENAVGSQLRDLLVGNHVDNQLSGLGGADVMDGLGGSDTLTGGADADRFVFSILGGTDRITDFTEGLAGEVIDLREIDANAAAASDQAFSLVAGSAGVAGQAALSYDNALNETTIRLFTDADAEAELTIIVNGELTTADAGAFLL